MYFIVFASLISSVASNNGFHPTRNAIKDSFGNVFYVVPSRNKPVVLVNQTMAQDDQRSALKTPFNVYFGLFTSKNPKTPQHLYIENMESIEKSNFNSTNPTRMVCHGWQSNNNSDMNTLIRDGYLSLGNFNVIIVDWSEAAESISYIRSAASTTPAAEKVASFIMFLVNNANLDPNNTYLIGHSLGAHVVGLTGKRVRPKINTIFGLDAAKPFFDYETLATRLSKTDARYVETIHSDGGLRGFERPIGYASFYPHFGFQQPGCHDKTTICDHIRSYMYFAESLNITNRFGAKKCKEFRNIVQQRCEGTGVTALMGGEPSNYGQGIRGEFYVPVNDGFPYAKGMVF